MLDEEGAQSEQDAVTNKKRKRVVSKGMYSIHSAVYF
jgi:hypothetical protein